MKRRTKNDMELMKNFVKLDLLANKNDPHKAYESMIKEHLEAGESIPYYIKGIKDYINVSKELSIELNLKRQNDQRKQNKLNEREKLIQILKEMNSKDFKPVYKELKSQINDFQKICLHDVYFHIHQNAIEDIVKDEAVITQMLNIELLDTIEKLQNTKAS